LGTLHTKDKTGVYNTDPVTVAIYAEKHGLLDTPGWKLDSRNEPRPRNDLSAVLTKQSYIRSHKAVYMYGFQVPRDYEQAVSIDEENKNTKWQDSLRKNSVRLMNMRPSMTNKG
jgi:hypothetical protein